MLWANKNFMKLACSYALVYGVYVSIGTSMSNLLNPFGYSPTDISIAGGTCLLAGVVAALIIGCYLDCSAAYKKTHVTLSVLTLLSTLLVIPMIMFSKGSLYAIMIPIVILGISSVSFFPTCLSYGAELTFPLQPALVNASMNFLGQITAFIMMGTATLITDVDASNIDLISKSIEERKQSSYIVIAIMAALCLVNLLLSCCVKQELRRLNYAHAAADFSQDKAYNNAI